MNNALISGEPFDSQTGTVIQFPKINGTFNVIEDFNNVIDSFSINQTLGSRKHDIYINSLNSLRNTIKEFDNILENDIIEYNKNTINELSFTKNIHEGATSMDNDTILSKYMEKVDRDQSDLKMDIRESARITTERIEKIEERMDTRLNRIEDLISKQNDTMDSKFQQLTDKIDVNNKYINNISIAVIIGIAAIAITVFIAVFKR